MVMSLWPLFGPPCIFAVSADNSINITFLTVASIQQTHAIKATKIHVYRINSHYDHLIFTTYFLGLILAPLPSRSVTDGRAHNWKLEFSGLTF